MDSSSQKDYEIITSFNYFTGRMDLGRFRVVLPLSQSWMSHNSFRWRFNLEKQTENENITEIFPNQKQLVLFTLFFSCAECFDLDSHFSQKWII